jgi:hypothetical protein
MCFSATASFATAAVTGIVGIFSLAKVNERRELPLAAAPIFFALQQGMEGLLWLTLALAPDGWTSTVLTSLFLFFAQVFWPVYAPIAVFLIEPQASRRALMLLCLAVGISVGTYLFWWILTHWHVATIMDDHLVYVTEYPETATIGTAYLVATAFCPMLSSRRPVVVLGIVMLIGLIVAYVFYWQAFVSVWCFFAAIASVTILSHFEWSRRQRLRVARV